MNRADLARFESWYAVEPNTGCWLWLGSPSKNGYGRFSLGDKVFYAHRVSYQQFKGPIPQGLQLDHLCRQRCCVNPDHLEPVTVQENVARGVSALTPSDRRGSCRNGHPYDPSDVITKRGMRECGACVRAAKARRKAGYQAAAAERRRMDGV